MTYIINLVNVQFIFNKGLYRIEVLKSKTSIFEANVILRSVGHFIRSKHKSNLNSTFLSKIAPKETSWKNQLHEIIYEADTKAGKLFDIILLIAIIASILLVTLESVDSIALKHGTLLNISEWVITILFSIEYILRLLVIKKPLSYVFSFYGIIDFLSTVPKYLSFFIIGSHNLAALRALRLLRVFRILKLARYMGASNKLLIALKASRAKIAVFLFFVVIICVILGTIMYMIEGTENGFTSIPVGVYWAIVTLTTVGFGDIAPQTPLGQLIASVVMILGYAIIAIPTGIVSAEITRNDINTNTQSCPNCLSDNHNEKSRFCSRCGHELN